MRLVRQADGSLALEGDDQASLRKQAKDKGQPLPTTPVGAAQITGSPDVAKMMGTQNQKQAALDDALKPQVQQSTVQRQAQARDQATSQELGSGVLAARLQSLRTASQAIQDATTQRLQNITQQAPTQLQLDEAKIAQYTDPQQQAIRGYYTTPSETSLQALARAFGNIVDPASFAQSFSTQLGGIAKDAFGQELPTLSELGMATPELAADLGVDEATLANMKLEDVQARMRAIESEEFSRVEALRAEFLSASPARREQIQSELKDLGQVGVTGVEASVDKLNQQLETADIVKFGGQSYGLGELLENEAVSGAIIRAVNSPEALEALRKTEPDLAAWIDTNKPHLQNLVKDMEMGTEAFQKVQTEFGEFTKATSRKVVEAIVGPIDFLTTAEMEALRDELTTSGVWQALSEDADINKRLQNAPDLIESLKGFTKAEIIAAREQAEEINTSPVLKELMGEGVEDFLLDPDQMDKYDHYTTILESLPSWNKTRSVQPALLELIKDGTFSTDEANIVSNATNPQRVIDDFLVNKSLQDELAIVEDVEDIIEKIFGSNLAAFNAAFKDMTTMSKYGIEPKGLKELKQFDKDGNGVIDGKDFDHLKARVASLLKVGADPTEVLKAATDKNNNLFSSVKDRLKKDMSNVTMPDHVLALSKAMEDNKLTENEIISLLADDSSAKAQLDLLKKFHPNEYKQVVAYRDSKSAKNFIDDTLPQLVAGASSIFESKDGKFGFRGGWEASKPDDLRGAYDSLSEKLKEMDKYPGFKSDPTLKKRYDELVAAKARMKQQYDSNVASEIRTWEAPIKLAQAQVTTLDRHRDWTAKWGAQLNKLSKNGAINFLKEKGLPAAQVDEYMNKMWGIVGNTATRRTVLNSGKGTTTIPLYEAWVKFDSIPKLAEAKAALTEAQKTPKPSFPPLAG
jgi:hypothetical protein